MNEQNEVMNNEEVMETAIETVEAPVEEVSVNGVLIVGALAALVGGSVLVYKKAIKPMISKRKAKKAQAEAAVEVEDEYFDDDFDPADSDEDSDK